MQSQSPLKGTEGTPSVYDSPAIRNCAPSPQERPGPQQHTPHSGPGYFPHGTQKEGFSTPRQRTENGSSRVQKPSSSSPSVSKRLIARLNLAMYKMYTNQTDTPFNDLLSLPHNVPRPITETYQSVPVPGYRNYDQHHPDYRYSDYNYYPTYNPDYPETYNPDGGRYVRYPIAHPSGWVKADRKKKGLPTNLTDPRLKVIPADPSHSASLYPPLNKPVNTPVNTPYFPNPDAVDLSPSYPAYGPQHWESPMQGSPYARRPSFDIHQPGRRDSYERRHSVSQRRQSVPHIPTIPEVGQSYGNVDSRRMSSGNIQSGMNGINGANGRNGIHSINGSPGQFRNTKNPFDPYNASKTTQEERESTEAWLLRKEREANHRAALPAPLGPTGPSPRVPARALPTTSPKTLPCPLASPGQHTSPGQHASPNQFASPGQPLASSSQFRSPGQSFASPGRPLAPPGQFVSPDQLGRSPSRPFQGPSPKALPLSLSQFQGPICPSPNQNLPSSLPSLHVHPAPGYIPQEPRRNSGYRDPHDIPAPGLELLADMSTSSTASAPTLPTPKDTPNTTPGTGHAVLATSPEEDTPDTGNIGPLAIAMAEGRRVRWDELVEKAITTSVGSPMAEGARGLLWDDMKEKMTTAMREATEDDGEGNDTDNEP
ncbi:hypothetical protein FPQ18DRAFT_377831 [Pyronema domesticum]|uniref:Uncharacterized protein n=1 Tax=Pyronema omphalodes (strain CBS 100304) TaxID=1076935 RepID=U4L4P6_PYROM|nr:hypothetical protein FPQ18DRAFT_377831 [Pyronema domesticum]CCX05005.1 Protein of unknown function [Pyronema omphalodes CBS 100304]